MSTDTPDFMSTVLLLFLWMCTIIIGTIFVAHLILPSVVSEGPISPLVFFFLIFSITSIIGSKRLYPDRYSRALMQLVSFIEKVRLYIVDEFSQVLQSSRVSGESKDDNGEGSVGDNAASQSDIKVVTAVKRLFKKGDGLTRRDGDEDESRNRLPLPNQGTPGDTAKENGELQKAINIYEEALDKYEQADGLTGEQEALQKEKIAETQDKLDTVRERKERIDEVQNPLQNAESSFQTAVAQHAHSNLIPARRDYRQARDQYKQALDALDTLEEDVFEKEGEITASVSLEAEYLPSKLVAWDGLSDGEQETLSDAGIGTLSDIRNAGDELIQELVEDGIIGEQLADRLRAVKWWHGEDERTFTSRKTIERQRDRAEEGHQML